MDFAVGKLLVRGCLGRLSIVGSRLKKLYNASGDKSRHDMGGQVGMQHQLASHCKEWKVVQRPCKREKAGRIVEKRTRLCRMRISTEYR